MAFADRQVAPDKRSLFERWLDHLSEDNRATVISWLENPEIADARIMDWIRDDDDETGDPGYSAGKESISKWRRAHGVR